MYDYISLSDNKKHNMPFKPTEIKMAARHGPHSAQNILHIILNTYI